MVSTGTPGGESQGLAVSEGRASVDTHEALILPRSGPPCCRAPWGDSLRNSLSSSLILQTTRSNQGNESRAYVLNGGANPTQCGSSTQLHLPEASLPP